MKNLPDYDIELSQITDYIFGSDLAKKAFDEPPFKSYPNMLRDIILYIDKLSDNCHMPEFTNHSLPHICSAVKRASEWGVNDGWLNKISSFEAGYLLMALIIHDIGMLSQDPTFLPDEEIMKQRKGIMNISEWVRSTHVLRLDKLTIHIIQWFGYKIDDIIIKLKLIFSIAKSHSYWPWTAEFISLTDDEMSLLNISKGMILALSSIVAVVDLLDEDATRCDTATLIKHKQGTTINIAHWLRHSLTIKVPEVKDNKIDIAFRKLLNTGDDFEQVYTALRNHYKLIKIYNGNLRLIDAQISTINFNPASGIPSYVDEITSQLKDWKNNMEFEYCLTEQLLLTFMKEALNIAHDDITRSYLNKIGLECLDLNQFKDFLTPPIPLTLDERIFLKILKSE